MDESTTKPVEKSKPVPSTKPGPPPRNAGTFTYADGMLRLDAADGQVVGLVISGDEVNVSACGKTSGRNVNQGQSGQRARTALDEAFGS